MKQLNEDKKLTLAIFYISVYKSSCNYRIKGFFDGFEKKGCLCCHVEAYVATLNKPTSPHLAIGIVAQKSGCNIETIRFYEKAGVLPQAMRAENGRRVYNNTDISRITFIRRARELGFSLDEVRGLLTLAEGSVDVCDLVQSTAQLHLNDIVSKIADLTIMQTVLGDLISQCEKGDITCPLIAALWEGRQRQTA